MDIPMFGRVLHAQRQLFADAIAGLLFLEKLKSPVCASIRFLVFGSVKVGDVVLAPPLSQVEAM